MERLVTRFKDVECRGIRVEKVFSLSLLFPPHLHLRGTDHPKVRGSNNILILKCLDGKPKEYMVLTVYDTHPGQHTHLWNCM